MTKGLVSIITIVKNGMPHIKKTASSIENQKYKNIEWIIQDGLSTDGTIEFIKSFEKLKKVKIRLESGKDENGADAINKAIKRCKGEIIGIINADDLLHHQACFIARELFLKNQTAAALYGGNKIINERGKYLSTFRPMEFDLLKLLRCELVPTTNGSFYNIKICKARFFFDKQQATCHDFDSWIRLSQFKILTTGKILAHTRTGGTSSTATSANYMQFCTDKLFFLTRFINKFEKNTLTNTILRISISGIYAWAGESIFNIEGKSKKYRYFVNKSLEYEPHSHRIQLLKIRAKSY